MSTNEFVNDLDDPSEVEPMFCTYCGADVGTDKGDFVAVAPAERFVFVEELATGMITEALIFSSDCICPDCVRELSEAQR